MEGPFHPDRNRLLILMPARLAPAAASEQTLELATNEDSALAQPFDQTRQ